MDGKKIGEVVGKKIIPVILVFLALIPLSVAECNTCGVNLQAATYLQTTGGPIYPGSPLYSVDVLADNIRLALNPFDNNAFTREDIMEERLAEFEATQDNSALNDYNTKLQGMPDDLQDQPNATREMVMNRLQVHQEVLKRVREQVPEQAKQGIDRAINRSDRCSEVIEKMSPAPRMKGPGGPEQAGQHGWNTSHPYSHPYSHEAGGPETVGTYTKSGSYVSLPATAEMGKQVTVEGRICNNFNSQMEKVRIKVVASKWMGLVKKTETRVYNLDLNPGQCYSYENPFTVPTHFLGVFLRGNWDVHIKVTGLPMDKEIIDTHKSIEVK